MPAPQNIYDNPQFFKGYKHLRDLDTGLNGVLEVPAMRALLPDLAGKHVLDLGCGFGDFARYARKQGAVAVTAVDLSQKMIEQAIQLTSDTHVQYVQHAIESYIPQADSFDLVVSSLALHYIEDYAQLTRLVYASLTPGGQFVFSVEHPVCTANSLGWVQDSDGTRLHWPLDRYAEQGQRQTTWFVDGVIKFHRTLQTYVNTLLAAGFRLDHFGEPTPLEAFVQARPTLHDELRRPPFLLLAASKPL